MNSQFGRGFVSSCDPDTDEGLFRNAAQTRDNDTYRPESTYESRANIDPIHENSLIDPYFTGPREPEEVYFSRFAPLVEPTPEPARRSFKGYWRRGGTWQPVPEYQYEPVEPEIQKRKAKSQIIQREYDLRERPRPVDRYSPSRYSSSGFEIEASNKSEYSRKLPLNHQMQGEMANA
ncbi:hypothetical protein TWF481_011641 [Arthrobotrys musiformis]|uniref:Uncharacterized protein n=1 Tax=Arthrobotrys musiformis TaxID=47236 RepID=A0AAV9VZ52_9PEZI